MNKLKGIRVSYGLTQTDMSQILSLSPSAYGMKERGVRKFTKSEIDIIISYFKKKEDSFTYESIFGIDK